MCTSTYPERLFNEPISARNCSLLCVFVPGFGMRPLAWLGCVELELKFEVGVGRMKLASGVLFWGVQAAKAKFIANGQK